MLLCYCTAWVAHHIKCRRCLLCNGFKFRIYLKSTGKKIITLCFNYRKAWWFQLHMRFSAKLERTWSFANHSDQGLISPITADKAGIQNGLEHEVGVQASLKLANRAVKLLNGMVWEFESRQWMHQSLALSLSTRNVGPRYIHSRARPLGHG